MLSFLNTFFHIKGLKILVMKLTVLTYIIFFTKDQPVLGQPSQANLASCDNVENNSNNNYESDITVL